MYLVSAGTISIAGSIDVSGAGGAGEDFLHGGGGGGGGYIRSNQVPGAAAVSPAADIQP